MPLLIPHLISAFGTNEGNMIFIIVKICYSFNLKSYSDAKGRLKKKQRIIIEYI